MTFFEVGSALKTSRDAIGVCLDPKETLDERQVLELLDARDRLQEAIATFDNYLKCSRQLRPLVRDLVRDILRAGTNVVMDFPANTAKQRQWFATLSAEVTAERRSKKRSDIRSKPGVRAL